MFKCIKWFTCSLVPRFPDFSVREALKPGRISHVNDVRHGTEEVKDPPTRNLHAVLQNL